MAIDLRSGIIETARALGMDPVELATIISFESGFNPDVWGGKGGQHYGLIQFGPTERQQYGVAVGDPSSQLGAKGAIANYFWDRGWKPGMSMLDAYSIVNAGSPGLYNASDTKAGGTPGTVRNKVEEQMSGHRQKAVALIGGEAGGPTGQYNLGPTDPLGAFNTRNPASAMQPPQSISGIGSPSTYATTPRTTPDATATDPYGASSPGGGTGGTQPATGPYEPLVVAAAAKDKKHPLEALGEGIGDAASAMGKAQFGYNVPATPGAARVDVPSAPMIDPQQADMRRQMLALAMQRLNQGTLF